MRHRVGALLYDAPLLFIGVVLGLAVVFRVAIGALRPTSVDPEAPPHSAAASGQARALHEPPRIAAASDSISSPAPPAADTTASTSMPAGGRPRLTHPMGMGKTPEGVPPRKKPRTHGRR